MDGWAALEELVADLGGVEVVAAYVELDADVISAALAAQPNPRSPRVASMVWENTRKLVLMPSQGGFFWRLTRKRVAKDWLILARLGQLYLPRLERSTTGELTDEQKARLDLHMKLDR